VAGVLAARGRSALVFRGEDGLDELTVAGPSQVWEVADHAVHEHRLDPADLGIARSPVESLRGADAAYNSSVVRTVLAGDPGPVRDAVLLNAAAALVAAGVGAPGGALVDRMGTALVLAARSVDEGAAADVLDRWVSASAA
jgi:anthranilate phosphoribosyltransferase